MTENINLTVATTMTDFGVVQKRDILGDITCHYVNVCGAQMDEAIKAKLIELGWTPPKEET